MLGYVIRIYSNDENNLQYKRLYTYIIYLT